MIPVPLIARAVIGGGVLALLIYELSKQGAAMIKATKEEAKTAEDEMLPIEGEAVTEEVVETVKEEVKEVAVSDATTTDKSFLKNFEVGAAKRTIKTHTTKTINKLLEEASAGTYAITALADTDLMTSLLEDYSKKYQSEVESGKLQLQSTNEGKQHFLNAVIS